MASGAGDPAAEKESSILSVKRNQAGSQGTEADGFFACGILNQMNAGQSAETAQTNAWVPAVPSMLGPEDEDVDLDPALAPGQQAREFRDAGSRARAERVSGHDQRGPAAGEGNPARARPMIGG
jgi:hypothetical protein